MYLPKSLFVVALCNMAVLFQCTTLVGQTVCPGNGINTVTTDWRDPNSSNQWNWTQEFFDAYVINNNSQVQKIQISNPFIASHSTNQNLNLLDFHEDYTNNGKDGLDFQPDGGWELLVKDLGEPGPTGNAVDNPFFALYNRYTGRIRAFLLVRDNADSKNEALVKMGHAGNRESALFSHAKPISTSIEDFPEKYENKSVNEYSNEAGYWLYADFGTAFDPCICKYPSQIAFEYVFLENYVLELEGEIKGKINQIVKSNPVDVNTSTAFKSAFSKAKNKFEEGKKLYNEGKEFNTSVNNLATQNANFLENKIGLQVDNLKQYTNVIP